MEETQKSQLLCNLEKYITDELIAIYNTIHEINNNVHNVNIRRFYHLRRKCRLLCIYLNEHQQDIKLCGLMIKTLKISLNYPNKLLLIDNATFMRALICLGIEEE